MSPGVTVNASQSFAPQGEINWKSCYPAAPPTGNIPIASQVWNFCSNGTKIMRAVEAQPFVKKPLLFDSVSNKSP